MPSHAVEFVHGLYSSSETWRPFLGLLNSDELELPTFMADALDYHTPKVKAHPLHAIPDVDVLADVLRTRIGLRMDDAHRIMLVGHSQGGLIIQRMLMKLAHERDAETLHRIHQVSLFACPNSGSNLLASVRHRVNLGAQVRDLEPYNRLIGETHRAVQRHFLVAGFGQEPTYPHVRFSVYLGESDGVVPVESARGSFLDVQALPGDHSSIIVPHSKDDDRFRALIRDLKRAFSSQTDMDVPPTAQLEGGTSARVLSFRRPESTGGGETREFVENLRRLDLRPGRAEWLAFRQPSLSRDLVSAADRLQDRAERELLTRMGAALAAAVSEQATPHQRAESTTQFEMLRRQFFFLYDSGQ